MSTDRYVSPLSERYASKEMQYIFSPDMKFCTWRKLWIALAETEMELGLSQNGQPVITQEQIDELKAHAEDINYEVAREREKERVPAARAREKEQVPAERAAAATEPAGAPAAATPLMTMSVFPTPRARILPSPAIKTETRIPTTSGSRTVWPGRENMWTTIPS